MNRAKPEALKLNKDNFCNYIFKRSEDEILKIMNDSNIYGNSLHKVIVEDGKTKVKHIPREEWEANPNA